MVLPAILQIGCATGNLTLVWSFFPKGYTLIAPLNGKKPYLIGMRGRFVRAWESNYSAGQNAYFLENGLLLRAATLDNREQLFGGAGQGGRVQEFDWGRKVQSRND